MKTSHILLSFFLLTSPFCLQASSDYTDPNETGPKYMGGIYDSDSEASDDEETNDHTENQGGDDEMMIETSEDEMLGSNNNSNNSELIDLNETDSGIITYFAFGKPQNIFFDDTTDEDDVLGSNNEPNNSELIDLNETNRQDNQQPEKLPTMCQYILEAQQRLEKSAHQYAQRNVQYREKKRIIESLKKTPLVEGPLVNLNPDTNNIHESNENEVTREPINFLRGLPSHKPNELVERWEELKRHGEGLIVYTGNTNVSDEASLLRETPRQRTIDSKRYHLQHLLDNQDRPSRRTLDFDHSKVILDDINDTDEDDAQEVGDVLQQIDCPVIDIAPIDETTDVPSAWFIGIVVTTKAMFMMFFTLHKPH